MSSRGFFLHLEKYTTLDFSFIEKTFDPPIQYVIRKFG